MGRGAVGPELVSGAVQAPVHLVAAVGAVLVGVGGGRDGVRPVRGGGLVGGVAVRLAMRCLENERVVFSFEMKEALLEY